MQNNMIVKGNWESFLTLDGERLLLVKRKHIFVIFGPLFVICVLGAAFITAAFFLFLKFYISVPLFLTTSLLIISVTMTIFAKTIIDWYFNVYMLTTKKILEYRYTPLSSHILNGILLDKVNCTEIDLKKNGFISEMLDLGNLTITFDRPTHEEEFVLENMTDCEMLGNFLTKELMDRTSGTGSVNTIWFKSHQPSVVN